MATTAKLTVHVRRERPLRYAMDQSVTSVASIIVSGASTASELLSVTTIGARVLRHHVSMLEDEVVNDRIISKIDSKVELQQAIAYGKQCGLSEAELQAIIASI
jgi:bacterioferritin-associated ferredoxin